MLLSKQNAQLSAISAPEFTGSMSLSYLKIDPISNKCIARNLASYYISEMPEPWMTDDFPLTPMIHPDITNAPRDPKPVYLHTDAVRAATKNLMSDKAAKSSLATLNHVLILENADNTHYLLETNDLTTISIVPSKNQDTEVNSTWPCQSRLDHMLNKARKTRPETSVFLAVSELANLIKIMKAHHVEYLDVHVRESDTSVMFEDADKQITAFLMPCMASYSDRTT